MSKFSNLVPNRAKFSQNKANIPFLTRSHSHYRTRLICTLTHKNTFRVEQKLLAFFAHKQNFTFTRWHTREREREEKREKVTKRCKHKPQFDYHFYEKQSSTEEKRAKKMATLRSLVVCVRSR